MLALSPEDMIVDRLAAWQFWRSTTDGASALLVWRAQEKRLDRTRLAALADIRGVQSALARLVDFAQEVGERRVSGEELETWANATP